MPRREKLPSSVDASLAKIAGLQRKLEEELAAAREEGRITSEALVDYVKRSRPRSASSHDAVQSAGFKAEDRLAGSRKRTRRDR